MSYLKYFVGFGLLMLALLTFSAEANHPGACAPGAPGFPDDDFDGCRNTDDNCTERPNANQFNAVQGTPDIYGNRCDTDFDQDGATSLLDIAEVLANPGVVPARPWLDVRENPVPPYKCSMGTLMLTGLDAVLISVPGPSGL